MDIHTYRLMVGGFGAIHHEQSKGVESYVLLLPNSIDNKTFDAKATLRQAKSVKSDEKINR
ncbi:hypothetical protein OZX74_07970 [Bifidobacterium sp. ESL0798]|uniref:hypothetical protein n=1 Tax=Bifidobacterium sp. ESL0798 TaxID=2983235 RepID=UPI0023F96BA2|nr:hypothetical protein [Bifidobacterium sp. ESL0798]WEV73816.1 hypothetical protein OZX74_07970 [Bifidobacterium sp. ESL0798]